ncbi:helix-turn-helix domain-containing protein [Streptacidiphilus carbonis]|uniref:helix-turn-helix domain-containing protein n=1 Tax=Streptacidiphilus carbonis TaxID=105422 RepID=UPI0006938517|nr:helix-turn-helix domain-containing protein [Streptacidiphilus carbonis]
MTETDVPGVVVPPELAALVGALLHYGVAAFASRNGALPTVPGLEELREQLRVTAGAASGRRPRMLGLPGPVTRYLTVDEAAELMGVCPRQVRRLSKTGALIARKPGRDWQVDAESATDYGRRQQAWQRAA